MLFVWSNLHGVGHNPDALSQMRGSNMGSAQHSPPRIKPHTMHIALEAAVREHLQELGEMRPRVD